MTLDGLGHEWRDSERSVVDYPITLLLGRARMPGRLIDVSDRGMRLSTKTCQALGDPYVLEVRMQGEIECFNIVPRWDYFFEDHFVSGAELLDDDAAVLERWKSLATRLPETADAAERETSFEQRLARRLSSARPILFQDKHRWVKGTLYNVTEGGGGAQMQVPALHPPGGAVRFKVKVDGAVFEFNAQTVWFRFEDGQYRIGVRFIQPMRRAGA